MNIVIPSYENHIQFNLNFLSSFRKHCLDKNDVQINFICCNYNHNLFLELQSQFRDLNVNIFTLSQLIKKVDNFDFDDSTSNFYTKYPLQSLKKLFAYSVVDTDYLVMDSENLCLKDFYFGELYSCLKNKKIKHSDEYTQPIQHEVVFNCNNLLNYENNTWCFLDPYWLFEKSHVEGMIHELKEINNDKATLILKDKIFFDYQLYCTYLLKHILKDKIEARKILQNYTELQDNLDKSVHNFEYICSTLTSETLDSYVSLLNETDERITRLHWMPENFADEIIKNTKICIGTYI